MMTTAAEARQVSLADIRKVLEADLLCGSDLSVKVRQAEAADLMSDVLALSEPGMILLTGLVSNQVIRTAVVADLCGVVFVRGKKPGEEILRLAGEAGIPVMSTPLTMFEASGRLRDAFLNR